METRSLVGALICAVLTLLLSPPTFAQVGQFRQYTNMHVDPDFDSGEADGVVDGSNAVVSHVQSFVNYRLDLESRTARLSTAFFIRGNWGNPGTESPHYDFLEEHGLRSSNTLQLTNVTEDGDQFRFVDTVVLTFNGHATLYRDEKHTFLNGFFYGVASGMGAVPTSSSSFVQIYEYDENRPEWLPDWEVRIESEWLVTTDYYLVPAPGSVCLIASGIVAVARRRRR